MYSPAVTSSNVIPRRFKRHAGTPYQRDDYLQFLFSSSQPPNTPNTLESPEFSDFPTLHRPGSWQSLLHDPSNSLPRSRLIPFLPLASILVPASCRIPSPLFKFGLPILDFLILPRLALAFPHILPLFLSQSSLCSCARFVLLPDRGAPIAEPPHTSHDTCWSYRAS